MRLLLQIVVLAFMLLQSCTTVKLHQNEANIHINNLREGILLVRLKTSSSKIDLLKKAGREEEALSIAEEQEGKNRLIINAFTEHFDFCPVYFFYAPHSGQIRSGNFEPFLLTADLASVTDTSLQSMPFLFAEFGLTQASSGNSGLPALIMMDKNFSQLKDPFPFAVRTSLLGVKEMEARAAKQLNLSLHEFLVRSNLRQQKLEIKRAKKQLKERL